MEQPNHSEDVLILELDDRYEFAMLVTNTQCNVAQCIPPDLNSHWWCFLL